MKTRKGTTFGDSVVTIILVFIAVFLIIVLLTYFGVVDVSDFQTTACKMSNRIKGIFPKIYSGTAQTFGFVRFCKPQQKIIDPQDWGECSEEFKAAAEIDMASAARNCTMQQIWDLSINCWEMGGGGTWDPGSFRCYTGVVELKSDVLETGDIKDEEEFRDLYKEDIRYELGCLPDQTMNVLNTLVSGCRCDSVVTNLANHYAFASKYNALSTYFTALIMNDPVTSKSGSEGYLVYCATPNADPQATGAKLLELDNPTLSRVSSIVAGELDLSKSQCGDAINSIYDALIKARSYSIDAEAERAAIKSKLGTCVKQGEEVDPTEETKAGESPVSDYTGKIERIDALMEKTRALTASVPSMEAITKRDLQAFGKDHLIPGTKRTYAFDMSGAHKLNLYGEYKIAPGSLFEINFCNGVPLGAGIIATEQGCLFDATSVQIGAAGSGVAGVGRAGSPICHMTSIVGGIPGVNLVNYFCEGRYWRVGQTLGA
tara:strand:+ start:277 stop:1737 length:1461 start_codon:yes stop_codon:yes gene_type:complete